MKIAKFQSLLTMTIIHTCKKAHATCFKAKYDLHLLLYIKMELNIMLGMLKVKTGRTDLDSFSLKIFVLIQKLCKS